MRSAYHILGNFLKIVTLVVFLQFLAKTLNNNHIRQLGYSFGEQLREKDDDLDLKELDQEINELEESLGAHQRVVGRLINDDFIEGVQHGYFWPEYTEELLSDTGGQSQVWKKGT